MILDVSNCKVGHVCEAEWYLLRQMSHVPAHLQNRVGEIDLRSTFSLLFGVVDKANQQLQLEFFDVNKPF